MLLRTRFQALSRFSRLHTSSISCSAEAGLSGAGFATSGSAPWPRRPGLHPDLPPPRPCNCLPRVFLPRSTHELPVLLATLNRSGLRPSFPARPICFSAFRPWSASLALPTAWPIMPSADFCAAVRSPLDSLSSKLGTWRRPPGVSSVAFRAQLPNLRDFMLEPPASTGKRGAVRPSRANITKMLSISALLSGRSRGLRSRIGRISLSTIRRADSTNSV